MGDNLVAEKGAFTFSVDKVEEIKEVPFVYCSNIIAKVADIVGKYKRCVDNCVMLIIQTPRRTQF